MVIIMNEKVEAALIDIENVYMDSWGLIGTRWPSGIDGGDTSHKMAHLAIAMHLLHSDMDGIAAMALIHRWGPMVRHPDIFKWYSNPKTFSRDQFSPRVIAASLLGLRSALNDFFSAHLKHFLLFAWNTIPSWNEGTKAKMPDITGLENLGFYIRGYRLYLFYPLLFIFDLETLINAIIKRFDSDFDINNGLAAQILAMKIMPTGLGHLAFKIMKPVIVKKLQQYWSKERNEPPIDVLYIEGLRTQGLL